MAPATNTPERFQLVLLDLERDGSYPGPSYPSSIGAWEAWTKLNEGRPLQDQYVIRDYVTGDLLGFAA